MVKQNAIGSRHLWGRIAFDDVTPETMHAVMSGIRDNPDYIALGKRIIRKVIEPHVWRFIDLLRTNYGQFWIREPYKYDSRRNSMDGYFALFNTRWRADDGITWNAFEPAYRQNAVGSGPLRFFPTSDFLKEEDWRGIEQVLNSGYSAGYAAILIDRIRHLLWRHNYRHALIEAVIALELAISHKVRGAVENSSELKRRLQQFWELGLSASSSYLPRPWGKCPLGT